MRRRRVGLVGLVLVAVVLAGCARPAASGSAPAEDPAIAKARADEAKAKAAEAKAKAEEAAARAARAKADAKRARSAAAKGGSAQPGSAGSAAGSSYRSPTISITCTPDNYDPNVHFGGGWDFSTSTATLLIDYGDGRHYTTSHIPYFRSAYRHTYHSLGYFQVTISLTDGRGNVATDACSTGVHLYD